MADDSRDAWSGRSLTPLSGELVARDVDDEVDRIRRSKRLRLGRLVARPRRQRHWLVSGGTRLAIAFGIGCGLALLVAAALHRERAIGFYVSGAALLAIGFMLSSADVSSPFYDGYTANERHRRLHAGLAYVPVGLLVVGVGVLLEATG